MDVTSPEATAAEPSETTARQQSRHVSSNQHETPRYYQPQLIPAEVGGYGRPKRLRPSASGETRAFSVHCAGGRRAPTWETHCRGLEEGEVYPWAAQESRALIGSIFGCFFGADFSILEVPSRAWARTNSTMAIFTRRLGCLRELVSQETIVNGPESFDRLQEIFDRVTIVATEAALVSLSYVDSPPAAAANTAVPASPVEDSGEISLQPITHSRLRKGIVSALLMVAIAALVVGFAFAFSPAPVHHPTGPIRPGYVESTQPGPGAKTTGGAPSASGHDGSGTGNSPGSTSLTTQGRTSGVAGAGPGGNVGNGGNQTPGASTDTTSAGSTSSGATGVDATGTGVTGSGAQTKGTTGTDSGSTTVTLPGGIKVTVPQVTIPQVTLPGGTSISTPPITLPRL